MGKIVIQPKALQLQHPPHHAARENSTRSRDIGFGSFLGLDYQLVFKWSYEPSEVELSGHRTFRPPLLLTTPDVESYLFSLERSEKQQLLNQTRRSRRVVSNIHRA